MAGADRRGRVLLYVLLYALLAFSATACGREAFMDLEGARMVAAHDTETLIRRGSSGIEDRRRQVIRSEAEWSDFWGEVHARTFPTPPTPALRFQDDIVVAAAMGSRPSGGYSIEVEGILREGPDFHVVVRERSPGPTCVTTEALTQPVVAVRIPRTSGRVFFEEHASVHVC